MFISAKQRFYFGFLLFTAILTLIDCVLLAMFLITDKILPIDNDNNKTNLTIGIFIICIRAISALIIIIDAYWFRADYKNVLHLWIDSIYCLQILVMLFLFGIFINYYHIVWSLVLQIVHLYAMFIYTFKLILYHYDNRIDKEIKYGKRIPVQVPNISEFNSTLPQPAKRSKFVKILIFINKNLLAISTFLMIILSFFITIMLRMTHNKWAPRQLMRLKFIGDIFIRIILSLIVPLIGSSIAFSCNGFDPKFSGRLMGEMFIYYLSTTLIATIEGLILVTIISPGTRSTAQVQTNTDNK